MLAMSDELARGVLLVTAERSIACRANLPVVGFYDTPSLGGARCAAADDRASVAR